MPSTREQPLNPRAEPPPVAGRRAARPGPEPLRPEPLRPENDELALDARERAARAGGFHESSYDLRFGLDVSVSEWPDDTTIPAALGER